jgi:release factor glutamine methyltransferase
MFAKILQAMKNSKSLFQEVVKRVSIDESQEEIHSLVYMVMEHLFSVSKTDIISEKEVEILESDENLITEIVHRLNTHEPIQYILEVAQFYNRRLKVTHAVLIPRPETEALIPAIIQFFADDNKPLHILDIGTGSGCIAVTLALELPRSEVSATDVSEMALNVARQNADLLKTKVNFARHDILTEEIPFTELDAIVSNPPYIARSEKKKMDKNVLEHEPHLALFVSDENPLIFYNAIAARALTALKKGGLLIVEINERFGKEVAEIFLKNGFTSVKVLKDISGKDRIVQALKNS